MKNAAHSLTSPATAPNNPWWRGATIYQIYPRSFLDTNGDGVGDLPGILAKLDYVATLGVEAIWVSPFFKSPMADFGYDIADYRAVDPIFGTLADFDRLIAKAHGLDLKVIIDQVLSHTSDQHAWFEESRQDRTNPKADWYVWADAREDGTPPNNWLSIFGGVAWTWEPRRGQYYLHNFLSQQPDLNFHHPDVRQASLDNMRFWLDRGVDGLRLDAINFCFHDALLRDNPARPRHLRKARGFNAENPYGFQWHRHNNTQPEMLPFLEDIRKLLDEFDEVVALGEISSDDSTATVAEYTQPGRLHMGYSFELLSNDSSPTHIRTTVETLKQRAPQSWPCWTISNHDVERVVSRWGRSASSPHTATQLSALLASLRGSVCVFQGEELGLAEADVPYEALRDPYGIAFWPAFKGRDGCRTPMPWDASESAGFSSAPPWLPVPHQHLQLSVAAQERDASSALHGFRRLLKWRKSQPLLICGDIEFLAATESVLAFRRFDSTSSLLAAFNLSAEPATLELPGIAVGRVLGGHGLPEGTLANATLRLPAHGVAFFELTAR
ncbi:MAG TPA: alpha-glucosidase family protein [Steroidobacteraceae bacterium]|jgi:alpha-glucosidase|nr:alpha-glucosidase family protein [Steroidobacteraceae bacterium]